METPRREPTGQQAPDGMADGGRGSDASGAAIGATKASHPSPRFVGQIGVLGWIIVTPTLIGLFIGRWLDHRLGTGIFLSAPLLMLGAAIGFWSAWRWMHQQ